MNRVALLAILALAACGANHGASTVVAPATVTVPVPVSCVPASTPRRPAPPATDASLKAAADAAARYQQLAEYYTVMDPADALAWRILEACRAAARAP